MEGKKGFPPSSLKGPAIFNLMCMKTLRNESRGEKGSYGGTVNMVAAAYFINFLSVLILCLSANHLPDLSYSLKNCY
jgi:hypothetical protein